MYKYDFLTIKYRMIAFVQHKESRYSPEFGRMLIGKILMAVNINELKGIVRKHQGFRIMDEVLSD